MVKPYLSEKNLKNAMNTDEQPIFRSSSNIALSKLVFHVSL